MAQKAKKVVLDTDKHAVSGDQAKKGAFNRASSIFLNRISCKVDKIVENDDGTKTFPAAKGRYHLYISPACPWCHRCWLTINLKGLQDVISISYVVPYLANMGKRGAEYKDKADRYRGWGLAPAIDEKEKEKYESYLKACGIDKDPLSYEDPLKHKNNKIMSHVADLYEHCDPDYSKTYSVPILWDKETDTIVNNESSIIIDFLNSEFNDLSNLDKNKIPNLSPSNLEDAMSKVNDFVYPQINNGVYASGFARSQVYAIVTSLFESALCARLQ